VDDRDRTTVTAPDSSANDRQPFRDRRFIPTEELGRGGMGVVFRCHDAELGREVAVKFSQDSGPEEKARLLWEAHMQARLQHPSIVPVYDVERAADGSELIVMREVAGRTLRAILRERGATRHALLTAFSRVCRAIDYCHSKGVLHRDLKPENIMLGEYGEVYVMDWGLAVERDAKVQRSGGTLGYMAPEQTAGRSTELSDVYSLGVILRELLVDAELRDDGPPELVALAARASAEDPAARPSSARALAEAVDRFLDGERDLAQRRKLADEAARDARAAVVRGERRASLREAGRALALDPDHDDARRVLRDLLTTPPAKLPTEVETTLREHRANGIRASAAAGALGFATTLLLIPLELAMGVRDVPWYVARVVLAVAALLACIGLARWWRPTIVTVTVAFGLSMLMMATTALVLGPGMMVPCTAVLVSALLGTLGGRRWVISTSSIAALLLVGPVLLELAGVLPPSSTFAGGDLVLHPRLLDLPPALTTVYRLLKDVLIVVVMGLMMSRYRDTLARAEEMITVQAWQLEQLVPEPRASQPRL
jgi:eukaryotic-like serine/threonine-protein kinase